jgi:CHAD domain-containing protein
MNALPAESISGALAKSKLPRLAKKRLERFVTLYPKALVSDKPEVVHDLRVASRRLQQMLRVLLPNAGASAGRKIIRRLRKVRRAFGSCRNLDASIHLIDSKLAAITTGSLRSAWDAVRQWLDQKRVTEIKRGRTELKRHDLTAFIARAQACMETLEEEADRVAHLRERARDALGEWRDALVSAKQEPQNERIHALRVAGKRLRYRAETLAELGDPAVKSLLDGLKALQDDLGNWHDRSVLRDLVAEFIGRPGFLAEEPGMCRALLLDMERDKQRDRAAINDVLVKAEEIAEKNAAALNADESSS